MHAEEQMSAVLTAVCIAADVHPSDLLKPSRKAILCKARHIAWVIIQELWPTITQEQIADFFQRERSSVSSCSNRMRAYIQAEENTRRLYEQAMEMLEDQRIDV